MLRSSHELHIPVNEHSMMPQSLLTDKNRRNEKLVVVFRQDQVGSGDQTVGRKLVQSYLEALLQLPLPPQSILFYNTGVRLLTEDSEAADALSRLENKGCELLACNISLRQLKLSGKLITGEICTLEIMLDRQMKADKILWP